MAQENVASTEVRFPDITVKLVGEDGNAYSILARVQQALRRAGHGDKVEEYITEAQSGDYDNLIRVTCRWVEVE